jgi:F-type H+-transporting ATPase subunit epsilon
MADDVDLPHAEKELAEAQARMDEGETDEETRKHFSRAQAQVLAAQKVQ